MINWITFPEPGDNSAPENFQLHIATIHAE